MLWAAVSETPFLSDRFMIWSTLLVVMFFFQLEDGLPLLGSLSFCSSEVAMDEL